jgi:predicted short-subunit dehydrogenase-like oxidoreductase (DUF2520 family)
MIRIGLIGNGNLAFHLHQAIERSAELELTQLIGRDPEKFAGFNSSAPLADFNASLIAADVYLLAVSDSAIVEIAGLLPDTGALLLHCSGAVPLDALKPWKRRGVLYPLQTFSRNRAVNFTEVPLCIEAAAPEDYSLLKSLADLLSLKVVKVDSDNRLNLHQAAVYINNFTNHLVHLGQDFCRKSELPTEMLQPLLRETFEKLEEMDAYSAQTGPARRRDTPTLQKHLNNLDEPLEKQLYQILTQSIQNTYEKER